MPDCTNNFIFIFMSAQNERFTVRKKTRKKTKNTRQRSQFCIHVLSDVYLLKEECMHSAWLASCCCTEHKRRKESFLTQSQKSLGGLWCTLPAVRFPIGGVVTLCHNLSHFPCNYICECRCGLYKTCYSKMLIITSMFHMILRGTIIIAAIASLLYVCIRVSITL